MEHSALSLEMYVVELGAFIIFGTSSISKPERVVKAGSNYIWSNKSVYSHLIKLNNKHLVILMVSEKEKVPGLVIVRTSLGL